MRTCRHSLETLSESLTPLSACGLQTGPLRPPTAEPKPSSPDEARPTKRVSIAFYTDEKDDIMVRRVASHRCGHGACSKPPLRIPYQPDPSPPLVVNPMVWLGARYPTDG
jgi:hypothetical protein